MMSGHPDAIICTPRFVYGTASSGSTITDELQTTRPWNISSARDTCYLLPAPRTLPLTYPVQVLTICRTQGLTSGSGSRLIFSSCVFSTFHHLQISSLCCIVLYNIIHITTTAKLPQVIRPPYRHSVQRTMCLAVQPSTSITMPFVVKVPFHRLIISSHFISTVGEACTIPR